MDVDPSPTSIPREQADSDPYKRAEKLIQDILKAWTASQLQQLIEDAAQSGREPSAYPVSRASFIAGATDN